MAEVTTTLKDIEVYDGVAKASGKAYTKFTAKGSDGRGYVTFKRDIVESAVKLKGQAVVITYSESQNGDYTNYALESIRSAPQEATGGTEKAQQDFTTYDPPARGILRSEAPTASTYTAHPNSPTQEKKDASIARAVAFKGAVELAAAGVITIESPASVLDVAEAFTPWLLGEALTKGFEGFADLAIGSSEVESSLAKVGL